MNRAEEGGRYLEAYKVYENKPAEALMERVDTDHTSKVRYNQTFVWCTIFVL